MSAPSTAIYDRLYGEEAAHVDELHSFDELAKLGREERRALMRQLERQGLAPFVGPTHLASH